MEHPPELPAQLWRALVAQSGPDLTPAQLDDILRYFARIEANARGLRTYSIHHSDEPAWGFPSTSHDGM